MKKIETIWQELLWSGIDKQQFKLTQKQLAEEFGYSLSTVNLAVSRLEKIGAVKTSGRFFVIKDVKKLLYYWATHREISKDVIYQTKVDEPVMEIEGLVPGGGVLAGFTAGKQLLKEAVTDYERVYVYYDKERVEELRRRFGEEKKQEANLIFLASYPGQEKYGAVTSISQTFVDLWGMKDWYVKDWLEALERRIDELLS